LKALTLWQPWASLMAYEEKKVETRSWSTKYRGPIAIHAALSIPRWLGDSRHSQDFHDAMMKIAYANGMFESGMPKGVVLCTADLVVIEPTEKVHGDLSAQEQLFGNYEDGRYAWFFENVKRFDVPVPAKGNRMLWNWPNKS
jgi:activating signal cointegrator 1